MAANVSDSTNPLRAHGRGASVKPFPFHTSEDCETALTSLGKTYDTEDVHYTLVFPDTEAHRLSIGRFLLGDDFHAVPRQTMLQGFDPYMQAGQINMYEYQFDQTVTW